MATSSSAQDVSLSATVSPSTVKLGQEAVLTVTLRNNRQDRAIPLKATATYTVGNQSVSVDSNTVTLNVDASLNLRLAVPLQGLYLVTAQLDGKSILPASNTQVEFDIFLPADNADHTLTLRVR